MTKMAQPKPLSNDEYVMEKDNKPVPKRIIRKSITTVKIDYKIITNLSIGFKKSGTKR